MLTRGRLLALALLTSILRAQTPLAWQSLPSVPDREGFAGSFSGVSGGALLVAGGANFPGKPPWEGGTKTWHDSVFILEPKAPAWRIAGRLPVPNGYGVSITTEQGVVLIGGGDARQNFSTVQLARWDGEKLAFETWPSLPRPLAMSAGALVGRVIFVAGGMERPDATRALAIMFTLDLDRLAAGWREMPPFPGPERFLATAATDGTAFFLFSGARLVADADGKPTREWLRDAWRYTGTSGWTRLADLPRAAVAPPSPAPHVNGKFLILGGDDGTQVGGAPTLHKGFPRDVLAYDPARDRWSTAGEMPFSLVTTSTATWLGTVVVPGGETRPGIRSPAVWAAPAK